MQDILASVPIVVAALAAVLALVGLLAWLARRAPLPRGGARRLVLQEALALDPKRRLCLVCCDGRSLLLLTGGSQDVVVGWLPEAGPP